MEKFIDIDYVSQAGKEGKQKEERNDDFIPGSYADPPDTNQKTRTWHRVWRVIDDEWINPLIIWCFYHSVFYLPLL